MLHMQLADPTVSRCCHVFCGTDPGLYQVLDGLLSGAGDLGES